jgi:basic membrane protein A
VEEMKLRYKHALWKKIGIIFLVLSFTLTGCSILDRGSTPSSPQDGSTKVGLITGEGGIGDSYYMKAWEGMQKAEKDFNTAIGYVKAKNEKDYASKLAQLRSEKYEMIFTIGSQAVPAVLEAAKKNPKIKYVCIDAALEDPVPANVSAISYRVEEAAFLAGYAAGKITKTNVVGFISGDNKDISLQYYYGFKAGVRYANAYCELMKGIAGTFTDKTRLETMAERMVESRSDVVFHVAGSAGKGMIDVMEKNGKYAIGADVDQNSIAPETVLTSVIKHNDLMIYETIEAYQKNRLQLGKNLVVGLAENGVGLAETTEGMIPEDIYNSIVQYQEKIMEGELDIPATENEYLSFTDN